MIRLFSSTACCKLLAADGRRERVGRKHEHHRRRGLDPRPDGGAPVRGASADVLDVDPDVLFARHERPGQLLDEVLVLAGVGEEYVGPIPSGTWIGRALRAA